MIAVDRESTGDGFWDMVRGCQLTTRDDYSPEETAFSWFVVFMFINHNKSVFWLERLICSLFFFFCCCVVEQNPPINDVVGSGVVPRVVTFLSRDDFPKLQVKRRTCIDYY